MSFRQSQPARTRARQPHVAEVVADELRKRILSGELANGGLLSKQNDLIQEFNVSKPSIREALRILETEGLITVQRGNVGGAVVHAPRPSTAAYMLGLVLQSKGVTVGDVVAAIEQIEPACAALCAERGDRESAVVPRLRAVHQAAVDCAPDDQPGLTEYTRQFHEELVSLCGNQTLIQIVGALKSLRASHEQERTPSMTELGEFPSSKVRQNSLEVHEEIISLIRAGDAEGVARLARTHVEASLVDASGDDSMTINADTAR